MSEHPAPCLLHAHTPHQYSAHNLLRVRSCKNECTDSHESGVTDEPTKYSETLGNSSVETTPIPHQWPCLVFTR
jgi:hypothetical protein